MGRALKHILLAAASVGFVAVSHAAEPIKLKLLPPIYVDGKGTGIRQPEGVSCGGNSLLVADTGNGRLLQYTITGETWIPGPGIALPQVTYPIRVGVNSKREIYTLDGKSRRIVRVDPSGEFKGYVDFAGIVQGNVVPRSFRIDRNDNLYVLDVSSARILVLDPSGKLQREIPFPKEYGFFSDLAVDAGGDILLVDSVQRKVYKAAQNSSSISPLSENLMEEVYFPTGIETDAGGTIFLVDQNGSGIVILGKDGSFRGRRLSMGWKDGFLRYPAQMCISENGTAFIADRGNSRVESFLITE